MSADPLELVRAQIHEHAEERRQLFVVGFTRFCMQRGLQTPAPLTQGKKIETWWDVGRRLYGADLFDTTLAAEVEKDRAQKRVPAVRGDQGKDGEGRKAARGRKDQRGEDHELEGRSGTAEPSPQPS